MSLDSFGPASSVEFAAIEDGELARRMGRLADETAGFLKALSHEGRLMILCHLAGGEKSVTELEVLLGQRQAAVSQQLARLRLEGLVATRREGKAIFYRIQDSRVPALLRALTGMLRASD
jgi:DNA-binding transcriptional ArsR family regulator